MRGLYLSSGTSVQCIGLDTGSRPRANLTSSTVAVEDPPCGHRPSPAALAPVPTTCAADTTVHSAQHWPRADQMMPRYVQSCCTPYIQAIRPEGTECGLCSTNRFQYAHLGTVLPSLGATQKPPPPSRAGPQLVMPLGLSTYGWPYDNLASAHARLALMRTDGPGLGPFRLWPLLQHSGSG